MEKVTQASAATAEKTAAASEELHAQAEQTMGQVLTLTRLVGNAGGGVKARVARRPRTSAEPPARASLVA